jgi:hypothetical protein
MEMRLPLKVGCGRRDLTDTYCTSYWQVNGKRMLHLSILQTMTEERKGGLTIAPKTRRQVKE